MKENNKSILLASIAVLSWSTVASAFKIALRHFSHYEMLLVAALTSLLIFSVVMTAQSKWSLLGALSKREWGKFALIGLLNPVAYYLVLFRAYALLPAQIAQPVNYSWPIVLLIMIAVIERRPIPKMKYIGMALSLGGVALISLGSGAVGEGSFPVGGLLLAFLSAFLWAAFWMVGNLNKAVDGIVSLFLSFLFGSIYLLAGTFFVEVDLSSLSGILSSIYVGAFEMGIPFVCFGLALQKTNNPALINQMCYLSPFLSLFLIHLLLGEQITPNTYVGLFLIVSGIVFNQYFVRNKVAA